MCQQLFFILEFGADGILNSSLIRLCFFGTLNDILLDPVQQHAYSLGLPPPSPGSRRLRVQVLVGSLGSCVRILAPTDSSRGHDIKQRSMTKSQRTKKGLGFRGFRIWNLEGQNALNPICQRYFYSHGNHALAKTLFTRCNYC